MRKTILPWFLWALIWGGAIGLAFYASRVGAEPLAQVVKGDVRVVLYKGEPCALAQVSSLPYRATWEEGGKTYEGCWGGRADLGLVVTYFDDGSIALIPVSSLVRVHSL